MNTQDEDNQTRINLALEEINYWIKFLSDYGVPVVFYTNEFRMVDNVRLVKELNLDRFKELEGWGKETHIKEPKVKLDSVVLS